MHFIVLMRFAALALATDVHAVYEGYGISRQRAIGQAPP